MRSLSMLGVVLLVCLLTGADANYHKRDLQASCKTQKIDKKFHFVVDNFICSYFRPANATERGPAVDLTGTKVPISCVLVNNSFPGPTMRVTKGDWVQVDITSNLIGREVSFHWHGLTMTGTPWSDGAVMVNSCPINPGQSISVIWQATEAGSFFYHGHAGLEEEYGLSGALIIDDPEDPYTELYDEDLPGTVMSIRDWWQEPDGHAGNALVFRFYQTLTPFGVPLFNGAYGNGKLQIPLTDTLLAFPVLNLAVNTCYRSRLLNGNTEWPGWKMNITDENHQLVNFTVIALTAENLQPIQTQSLTTFIAQRAEFVFCTKDTPVDWMVNFNSAQPEDPTFCFMNNTNAKGASCIFGFQAILRIGGINSTLPKTADRKLLTDYPFVDHVDALTNPEVIQPYVAAAIPTNPTQTWNIYLGITSGNMYAWTTRNIGLMMPSAPLLFTNGGKCGTGAFVPTNATAPARGYKGHLFKTVKHGEVVDIIINNLSPFMHPMHLHGHEFTVMGSRFYTDAGYAPQPQNVCPNSYMFASPSYDGVKGPPWPAFDPITGNRFSPFSFGCPKNESDPAEQSYMLSNPYSTDIVPVPAHGWAHVRVKFDNPGTWYMHCHLSIHMLGGMGFFINAGLDKVPKIPSWVDTSCGGACMSQNQVCGDYAPTKASIPKCFAPTTTNEICAPSSS